MPEILVEDEAPPSWDDFEEYEPPSTAEREAEERGSEAGDTTGSTEGDGDSDEEAREDPDDDELPDTPTCQYVTFEEAVAASLEDPQCLLDEDDPDTPKDETELAFAYYHSDEYGCWRYTCYKFSDDLFEHSHFQHIVQVCETDADCPWHSPECVMGGCRSSSSLYDITPSEEPIKRKDSTWDWSDLFP